MRLKRPNQLLPKWKARAKRKQFFSRLNNALDEQLMIRMRLQALIDKGLVYHASEVPAIKLPPASGPSTFNIYRIKKEQPLQPLPEN